MAITDKKQGVWNLDEVYNKQNEGDIWTYFGEGSFLIWGNNDGGQLGLNDTVDRSSPVQLPGTWNSVVAMGTGEGMSGGIKTDGTLWSWGYNNQGALGLNDIVKRSSPTQIGTDTNWATGVLSSGNYWTLMLKTNGTLWSWGRNSEGELGQNNNTAYSSPTQIGTDTTWNYAQDKCDQNNKMGAAIKTDGTLWTWGTQDQGGLGHNQANTTYSSPKQVGTNTTWNVVSAGGKQFAAIKTDGTLWACGQNDDYGNLGFNNRTSYSSPKQVGTDTTWSQVKCFNGITYAIKTNGTLWGIGNNSTGNLGLNDTNRRSSPTQIGTSTNWESIRGCSNALAKVTKTDGTLWLWGRNSFGGAIPGGVDASSPIQIPGTTWGPVVGGGNYGVAAVTE